MRTALLSIVLLLATPVNAQTALTAEAINAADLATLAAAPLAPAWTPAGQRAARPDPAMVRLQVLLDRAGASPGVIDGFDGDNVRKAVFAFETMRGLPADGQLDPEVLVALETGGPVIGSYEITAEDVD